MKKILRPSEDLFIEFTPEELNELGLQSGDKLSCKIEDGSIKLTKYAKIELDLQNYPRDLLIHLIQSSAEQDISVNDVLCNILEKQLAHTTNA